MALSAAAVARVVRVRETQEYDVEVTTSGNSLEAARLARRSFMSMTVVETAANSVGVAARSFKIEDAEFDDDELAGDE